MKEKALFASWLATADKLGELYKQAHADKDIRLMQAVGVGAQYHVLELLQELSDDTSVAELPFKAVMTALEGAAKGTRHPLLSTSKKPGPPTEDPIRVAMKASAVAHVIFLAPALGREPAAKITAEAFSKAGMLGYAGEPVRFEAILAWHAHPNGKRMPSAFAELVNAELGSFPELDSFLALSAKNRVAHIEERARELMKKDLLAKGGMQKPTKGVS